MAKPINLNHARKTRAKVAAKAKADQNAVAFGRPKAQKSADAAEELRITRVFDSKKRDPQ